MNNLRAHKPVSLYETFSPEDAKQLWDRFECVFTPKYGSWLNVAEIELDVLNGRCLNRRIDEIETIRQEIQAWKEGVSVVQVIGYKDRAYMVVPRCWPLLCVEFGK